MSAASSAASAVRRRVALVTGGNKGIGLEIVRQLASADPQLLVLLGSRDPARGKAGAAKLGLSNVTPLEIDVTSPPSIAAATQAVKKAHPEGLDLLINNAGVFLRGLDQQGKADVIDQTMAVNYEGPRDTCVTFWPLLNKNARSVAYTKQCAVTDTGGSGGRFLTALSSAFSLVLCLLRSLVCVYMCFQCGERGQSTEQECHDELLRRASQAAPRSRFHREGKSL
jgi:NAD(P)-dependent dehydrogenase (short-subunit alcohol dehydrogenase family)